jgi:hypothetical protein
VSHSLCLTSLCVLMCLPTALVAAQEEKEAKARPADEYVVKVYRVVDLVVSAPDHAYDGTFLPGVPDSRNRLGQFGAPMGGMGGGMMGGMGGGGGGMGGMGGGMFQVGEHPASAPAQPARGGARPQSAVGSNRLTSRRIDYNSLIDAIQTVIAPETWDEVGGNGSIALVGGALAIRQTKAVQAQVQEFLSALQKESGALETLVIRAHWLLVNHDQLEGLRKGSAQDKELGVEVLQSDALNAVGNEARYASGQVTCLNGQTVHVISGQVQNQLAGAIPVVGGNTPGYQPIVAMPHRGVLLQVTPSLLGKEGRALVDLHSTVSEPHQADPPIQLGNDKNEGEPNRTPLVQIDRTNDAIQQFSTSLRVPVAKPVLVAGMTFPSEGATRGANQLVLVLEVRSAP